VVRNIKVSVAKLDTLHNYTLHFEHSECTAFCKSGCVMQYIYKMTFLKSELLISLSRTEVSLYNPDHYVCLVENCVALVHLVSCRQWQNLAFCDKARCFQHILSKMC